VTNLAIDIQENQVFWTIKAMILPDESSGESFPLPDSEGVVCTFWHQRFVSAGASRMWVPGRHDCGSRGHA
jgi:hypothetical protein